MRYQKFFVQAGVYPIKNYLKVFGKEPVFYLFTYFFYHISNGNFKIYVLFFSFISYLFLFISIYLFYAKLNQLHNIIFAVLLIAFFRLQFGLSAHLVRQFLASSLIMFYLINVTIYNRNNWYLLIISIFIHTTALFFVAIVYLPLLKNKIREKTLILFLCLVLIIFSIFSTINQFFLKTTKGIFFINYIFTRTSRELSIIDFGMNLRTFTFLFLLMSIVLYLIYFKKMTFPKSVNYFYNIFLALCIFILVITDQPLLSIRFFYYTYFFLPFILPLVIPRINFMRSLIILFLFINFLIDIEIGFFKYDDILTLTTNNFFSYFSF
jgi:hypothetical protein